MLGDVLKNNDFENLALVSHGFDLSLLQVLCLRFGTEVVQWKVLEYFVVQSARVRQCQTPMVAAYSFPSVATCLFKLHFSRAVGKAS